jgi:radical SAM protein (TIGR01212 family)
LCYPFLVSKFFYLRQADKKSVIAQTQNQPFRTLSAYLKEEYGQKVYKVALDAGLTCPNRDGSVARGGCLYCNPDSLKPKDPVSPTDIRGQLTDGMARMRVRHTAKKFIAYFQSNTSTYAPVDYLEEIFTVAIDHEDVVGLAVSTRPDCLDGPKLKLLERINKRKKIWVELGLQSANDATLQSMNRAHRAEDFARAMQDCSERGIKVCAHVILGLPGEVEEDMLRTMDFLSKLGVWGIKFHQLQIMRDTPLFEEYKKGRIKTLGLEEYTWLVIRCLDALPSEVVVHRLCADTPDAFLVAPQWGLNKFIILERITRGVAEKRFFNSHVKPL